MKFIHAQMTFIHMKSFVYEHIHLCRWIKITLSFEFQAQALHSRISHPCVECTYNKELFLCI